MRVCFRVDASIEIGVGHVMRCLTLADELRRNGAETVFITRDHEGSLTDKISKYQHVVVQLPGAQKKYRSVPGDVKHADMLGVGWRMDADETINAINQNECHWLVVDHYAIDAKWHRHLRSSVNKIMVIDDLADRELDCDVLLDQTYGRSERDYRKIVPDSCQILVGANYALLRPEFSHLRKQARARRIKCERIQHVLISMGGTDPNNLTLPCLEGIAQLDESCNLMIEVVLGGGAPHMQMIKEYAEKTALNISVLVDVHNMGMHMLKADLAIGAAGTTTWERCCLGLPALIVVSAENQKEIARQVHNQGAVVMMEISSGLKAKALAKELGVILKNMKVWHQMSDKAFAVTAGTGVSKVVGVLSA